MSSATEPTRVKFKAKVNSFDSTVIFTRTDFKARKKSVVSIYYKLKGKNTNITVVLSSIPLEEFRKKIKKIL